MGYSGVDTSSLGGKKFNLIFMIFQAFLVFIVVCILYSCVFIFRKTWIRLLFPILIMINFIISYNLSSVSFFLAKYFYPDYYQINELDFYIIGGIITRFVFPITITLSYLYLVYEKVVKKSDL